MGLQDQPAHHPGVAGRAYPGTFLYDQALETAGWTPRTPNWWTTTASRSPACNYPHLSHDEIFRSVEVFYKRFYFRPRKIGAIVARWSATST